MWFSVFPNFFSSLDLFGYTVLYAILFAVLRFWMTFSSVLRFLVYPNAPLLYVNHDGNGNVATQKV